MSRKSMVICTEENIKKISKENMELWQEYTEDMILQKGIENSKQTLKTYKSAVFMFLIWLADNYGDKTILEINHKIVKKFLFWCQNELENRGKVRNTKTSAISSFINYLVREDYLEYNPLDKKLRRADISNENVVVHTFLTEEQVNDIRNNIENIKVERIRLQLRVFFELAFSTAARVGALQQFTEENLDLENRKFTSIREKTGKIKDLTFSKTAEKHLKEWIEFKKDNNIDTHAIFSTVYDGEYGLASISTLQDWSYKLGRMINVHLHIHSLRKSYANIMKRKGVPIEVIQAKLNHESSETTLKFYTKEDVEDNQKQLDKYEF